MIYRSSWSQICYVELCKCWGLAIIRFCEKVQLLIFNNKIGHLWPKCWSSKVLIAELNIFWSLESFWSIWYLFTPQNMYCLLGGGGAQRRKPTPKWEMAAVPNRRCFIITMTGIISLFLYVPPTRVLCCFTFLLWMIYCGQLWIHDYARSLLTTPWKNKKAMMLNTLEKNVTIPLIFKGTKQFSKLRASLVPSP